MSGIHQLIAIPSSVSNDDAIAIARAALEQPMSLMLPIKTAASFPPFPLNFQELLSVGPGTVQDKNGDAVASEQRYLALDGQNEALDSMAYHWNKLLSELPPKALPRGQRFAISLVGRKLTEKATGDRFQDYARRQILDKTRVGIEPTLIKEAAARVNDALEHAARTAA